MSRRIFTVIHCRLAGVYVTLVTRDYSRVVESRNACFFNASKAFARYLCNVKNTFCTICKVFVYRCSLSSYTASYTPGCNALHLPRYHQYGLRLGFNFYYLLQTKATSSTYLCCVAFVFIILIYLSSLCLRSSTDLRLGCILITFLLNFYLTPCSQLNWICV